MNKEHIVRKNEEFKKIMQKKNVVKTNEFIIYKSETENVNYRFGISISKKLGKAVFRNKNKRQIKSIIYELKNNLKGNIDYVLIVRENFVYKNYSEKKDSLIYALKKANAFKEI